MTVFVLFCRGDLGDGLLCEVRNSASFVLILSQNLFSSWWCALELREAGVRDPDVDGNR